MAIINAQQDGRLHGSFYPLQLMSGFAEMPQQ